MKTIGQFSSKQGLRDPNFFPNLSCCNIAHTAYNVNLEEEEGEGNCTELEVSYVTSLVRTHSHSLNPSARENGKCSLPVCPGKGNKIGQH